MGIAMGPRIITDGLVMYLDATNPNSYSGSGTAWSDHSKTGNHAVLVNGISYDSSNKGGMSFDGIDDYVSMDNLSLDSVVDNFTIITVLKFNTKGSGQIVWQAYGSYFSLMTTDATGMSSAFRLTFTTRGTRSLAAISDPLTAGKWYHVVCKREGGINYLHVNNYSYSYVSTRSSNGSTSFKFSDSSSYRFNGIISINKVYGKALSDAEITQSFKAFKGRYGLSETVGIVKSGLVLSVDSTNSQSYSGGTALNDISGNNNDFVLVNGSTGSINGGISFDGVNDQANNTSLTTSDMFGTADFSVDVWFKVNSDRGVRQSLVDKYNTAGLESGWGILYDTITSANADRGTGTNVVQVIYSAGLNGGNGRKYLNGVTIVGLGTVSNATFVRENSTTLKLYVNGSLDNSVAISSTQSYSSLTYNLTLSRSINSAYGQYLDGIIYATRVYNRALSAAEIYQNYVASAAKFVTIEYLIVGGGGGGGGFKGGGGGAGGVLNSTLILSTGTTYRVTIGAGGAVGTNGSNSVINGLTAIGGGKGGNYSGGAVGSGGSGGGIGGAHSSVGTGLSGGSGTPGQGNNGGANWDGVTILVNSGGAGGGGAGANGVNALETSGTNGGVGLYFYQFSTIGGTPSGWFGGGGGGGAPYNSNRGLGGTGGGGKGAQNAAGYGDQNAFPGAENSGGGGGGASSGGSGTDPLTGGPYYVAKPGGSGIIILKMPSTYTAAFSSGVTYTLITSVPGYNIYKVTATTTTSETVIFT